MYCVIVQPSAYDEGMEAECHVMGSYQSMEKAQEVADKINAKYPRLQGDEDMGRTYVCALHKSLRHMYGIIKERDHTYE